MPSRTNQVQLDDPSIHMGNILMQPDIVIKTNKSIRNASFQTGLPTSHTSQTTQAVTAAMVAKRAVSISANASGSVVKKQGSVTNKMI